MYDSWRSNAWSRQATPLLRMKVTLPRQSKETATLRTQKINPMTTSSNSNRNGSNSRRKSTRRAFLLYETLHQTNICTRQGFRQRWRRRWGEWPGCVRATPCSSSLICEDVYFCATLICGSSSPLLRRCTLALRATACTGMRITIQYMQNTGLNNLTPPPSLSPVATDSMRDHARNTHPAARQAKLLRHARPTVEAHVRLRTAERSGGRVASAGLSHPADPDTETSAVQPSRHNSSLGESGTADG